MIGVKVLRFCCRLECGLSGLVSTVCVWVCPIISFNISLHISFDLDTVSLPVSVKNALSLGSSSLEGILDQLPLTKTKS